jgi:large subunit ribosomal protein LX
MAIKPYRVTGEFWMGHTLSPFSQETIAADPEGAKDRVFSTIGSRHRVDRYHITIKDVVELKPDQVTDIVVTKRLSMVK